MIDQLITQLAREGGAIVSSNECTPIEIADARATGRFAADEHGFGYVRRTREWLALQKARFEFQTQAAADALVLCHKIEECGCSPTLTEASILASNLRAKLACPVA